MVEEIIQKHIADGGFGNRPISTIYPIGDSGMLLGISGVVQYPDGLHARPATRMVQETTRLGIGSAYVIAGARYARTSSILSLLMLRVPRGTSVSLVAPHDTQHDKLFSLYRVLVGDQAV